MIFRIVNKQVLADDVKRLDIVASHVAEHAQPGQFVMVMPREGGEWIPLTIVERDVRRGTIALIVRQIGDSTRSFGEALINDSVFAVVGPLGQPAVVKREGVVLAACAGVGGAQLLPVLRALKEAGNKVTGVIGARTRKSVMLETQMRIVCDKLFICTEDGSLGRRRQLTGVVEDLLADTDVQRVYTAGPVEMMEAVVQMARAKGIGAFVHLNPVMLCVTGVCGSCRVSCRGKTALVCQEGPFFAETDVDFADLRIRMQAFSVEAREQAAATLNAPHKPLRQLLTGIFKG